VGRLVEEGDCLCSGCHNKIPQIGWLKLDIYFLTVLEARSPRSETYSVLFLMRTHVLVGRWTLSCWRGEPTKTQESSLVSGISS
jgi:hypothetical protein